jgi:hypothetical protein
MIFSLSTYTTVHVVISLVGIVSGLVVMWGMVTGRPMPAWSAIFLGFTVLTSLTGFGFPFERLLPSHVVGALSLAVLLVAILALYQFKLAGAWRWIYVVTALTAQWLNVFVLIVQAFGKIPALNALAPTQSEMPFLAMQLVTLLFFITIGIEAARKFHPPAPA